MLQFFGWDLNSDYDVVGPYFNCPYTIESQYLHSIAILAFCRSGFFVRSLLCDGTSRNLCLLKLLCGYTNDERDVVEPWFRTPLDGSIVNLYCIVCPSHHVQLYNVNVVLFSHMQLSCDINVTVYQVYFACFKFSDTHHVSKN